MSKLTIESLEDRHLMAGDIRGALGQAAELVVDGNTNYGTIEIGSFAENSEGTIYFLAFNEDGMVEVWKTDGSAAGTRHVTSVRPDTNRGLHSFETALEVVGDDVYFSLSVNDGRIPGYGVGAGGPYELWKWHNESGTTRPLVDLGRWQNDFLSNTEMHIERAGDGTLLIEHNGDIWTSDGTATGSVHHHSGGFRRRDADFVQLGPQWLFSGYHRERRNYGIWSLHHESGEVGLIEEFVGIRGGIAMMFDGPQELTKVGERIFFVAQQGLEAGGGDLWLTDGTQNGTRRVAAIRPGGSDGKHVVPPLPEDLIALNERVLFTADDGIHGRELWVSDGTTSGTTMLVDLTQGSDGSSISMVGSYDGTILFSYQSRENAPDGNTTIEHQLWQTDGTTTGTQRIAISQTGRPIGLIGDKVLITSESSDSSWIIDLTNATAPLELAGPTAPANAWTGSQHMLFQWNDALWSLDADDSRPTMLTDFRHSNLGSHPAAITGVGEALFWVAGDGQTVRKGPTSGSGRSLASSVWRTDGEATQRLSGSFLVDLQSGTRPDFESVAIVPWRDQIFATGISLQQAIWRVAGDEIVEVGNSSDPPRWAANGNVTTANTAELMFASSHASLFRSDGTSQGTFEMSLPPSDVTYEGQIELFPRGRDVYFIIPPSISPTGTLWRSDGTESGTFAIDAARNLEAIVEFGSELFFVREQTDGGRQAIAAHDIDGDGVIGLSDFLVLSSNFGLVAANGMSDGDLDGNGVVDFGDFTRLSANFGRQVDDHSQTQRRELWQIQADGELKWIAEMTANDHLIPRRTFGHGPTATTFTTGDGSLFFTFGDDHIWEYNGASVKRRHHQPDASIVDLIAHNDQLLFVAQTASGRQLWTSSAGSRVEQQQLTSLPPGAHLDNLTLAGGRVFFTAQDTQFGKELWLTDGSVAGTQLAADVNPGPANSSPSRLTPHDGDLFFAADDGMHGFELWRVELD